MTTKQDHLNFLKQTRNEFIIDCYQAIFSEEEIKILKEYGCWFKALTDGQLQPITEMQKDFILITEDKKEPFFPHETAWYKYLGRKHYEANNKEKLNLKFTAETDTFYNREDVNKLKKTMFSVTNKNHNS